VKISGVHLGLFLPKGGEKPKYLQWVSPNDVLSISFSNQKNSDFSPKKEKYSKSAE
jgi:hypothetical protein